MVAGDDYQKSMTEGIKKLPYATIIGSEFTASVLADICSHPELKIFSREIVNNIKKIEDSNPQLAEELDVLLQYLLVAHIKNDLKNFEKFMLMFADKYDEISKLEKEALNRGNSDIQKAFLALNVAILGCVAVSWFICCAAILTGFYLAGLPYLIDSMSHAAGDYPPFSTLFLGAGMIPMSLVYSVADFIQKRGALGGVLRATLTALEDLAWTPRDFEKSAVPQIEDRPNSKKKKGDDENPPTSGPKIG